MRRLQSRWTSSGSAYVTGRTCSLDFPNPEPRGRSDAFSGEAYLPSGREFMFADASGGSGDEAGNGVAVDLQGNAYIAGQTTSIDLPTTQSALQRSLRGSVSYIRTMRWGVGTLRPACLIHLYEPCN